MCTDDVVCSSPQLIPLYFPFQSSPEIPIIDASALALPALPSVSKPVIPVAPSTPLTPKTPSSHPPPRETGQYKLHNCADGTGSLPQGILQRFKTKTQCIRKIRTQYFKKMSTNKRFICRVYNNLLDCCCILGKIVFFGEKFSFDPLK
jgi:hypothetical protein